MKKILMALQMLLFNSIAFASQFDLSDTDQSKRLFFDYLVGGTSLTNLSNSPIASVMMAFNSGILIIAGIMVSYTLIAGTVNTASDGEMLGKKWSSVWYPIRLFLGSSLLMPVYGGFSSIQMLVLWLGLQGAGFANTIWDAYLDKATPGAGYVATSSVSSLGATAMAMLKSNICVIDQNRTKDREILKIIGTPQFASDSKNTGDNLSFQYGEPSIIASNDSSCGQIDFPLIQPNTITLGSYSTGNELKSGLVDSAIQLQEVHKQQLIALNDKMKLLAQKVSDRVDDGKVMPDIKTEITNAVYTYDSAVSQIAQTVYSANEGTSAFREALKKDGWLFAGSYYMKFVYMQQEINKELNASPVVTRSIKDSGSADEITASIGAVEYQLTNKSAIETYKGQSVNGAVSNGTTGSVFGALGDMLKALIIRGNKSIFDVGSTKGNPIITAISFGNTLAVASDSMLGVAVGGSIISGTPIIGWFVPDIIGKMIGILYFAGFAIAAFSISMNVLLPMMPFLLWFGGIVSWVLMLIQAVVASPLWAVSHLAPDGDGIVGKAGQGYMLALGLLIRPALMILGLIISMLIVYPLGEFLNTVFFPTFEMSMDGSSVSFLGLFGSLTMYCGLLIFTIKRCFSLITFLPDTVLSWIGGNIANQFGKDGDAAVGIAEKSGQQSNAERKLQNMGEKGVENKWNKGREEKAAIQSRDGVVINDGKEQASKPNENDSSMRNDKADKKPSKK